MSKVTLDRRAFLNAAGVALLTVQSLPLIAQATANSPSAGEAADNTLMIQSSPGAFGHVHDLAIPNALLRTPPREGVELMSTRAFLHTHSIALSQKELLTVSQGGTVTKKGSSHLFVVALATRKDS
jgi:hypothetical protein